MSQTLSLNKVYQPRPGWYRGNFHSHTSFSKDARHTPRQLIAIAKEEGLDFFAITDHNSIGAYPEFAAASTDLLVIPGIEVTLTDGHFNVFGLPGWLDWLDHICVGRSTIKLNGHYHSTTELMAHLATYDLVSSINHPRRGLCEWRDGGTELRYVDCLEIWNKPHSPENRYANLEAVAMWTDWLNAGYRTIAIGGSDYHGEPGERLGLPSTYVYAAELSAAAVLAGLRQRQVYVSMGPVVNFQAYVNGQVYGMGTDLGQINQEVSLNAHVLGDHSHGYARIVKNGQPVKEVPLANDRVSLYYSEPAEPSQSVWYRLDVIDGAGQVLAVTNPIFAGPRRQPELLRFGDFERVAV